MPSRLSALAIALTFAASAQAGVQTYEAAWEEASWRLEQSAEGCRLAQSIPRYGDAEFVSRGGGTIEFNLSLARGSAGASGWAVLRTVAPLWQPGIPSREMGTVMVQAGNRPFRLSAPMAWRLLGELERGMSPTFFLGEDDYRREQVRIALSAMNFLDNYRQFLGCIDTVATARRIAAETAARESAKALDSLYNAELPNRATLFFGGGSDELSASAKAALDKVVAFIQKQPNIEMVIIDGHADDRGNVGANMALSKRRGEAIKSYLIANTGGLEPIKVRVRTYGNKYPAVPSDLGGTPRNRRALLLVRTVPGTGPGKVIEKAVESTTPVRQATEPEAVLNAAGEPPEAN